MDDMDAAQTGSPAPPSSPLKQRITYACEACRVSKAKCEPSTTEGICRRCFASKRECIFRTGPRKRRRRSKLHPAATRSTPPPCAPSKTFTIDVPMPAVGALEEDPLDSLGNLKDFHEGIIESLVSDDADADADDLPGMLPVVAPDQEGSASSSATSRSTRSSTSALTGGFSSNGSASASASSGPGSGPIHRSTHSFRSIQPQFNLDSATSLLGSFVKGMLPYFPVLALPPDASVPSLAKETPFVLLAILAAASGVRSVQGHSLYDEEFRKVLGLKFVSGGERSLELLVGLLIYCAWYPFHLRPKNRQAQQYIRMAGDIARDLDLDEPSAHVDIAQLRTDGERTARVRAYLACYYLSSVSASAFQKKHTVPYTQWTETCCSVLDRESGNDEDRVAEADRTLVWLARLGYTVEETTSINFRRKGVQPHGLQHWQLVYKGLEAQLGEWRGQMPPDIAAKPVVGIANWCTEILLYGQPLLKFPRKASNTRPDIETLIDPERLLRCVNVLCLWFDFVVSLPPSEYTCFTSIQWSYFVMNIILGLKLSFPLPHDCPTWDHAAARKTLDLGSFFDKFFKIGGSETQTEPVPTTPDRKRSSTDVLSASKVVVGVVQSRYKKRLAGLEKAAAAQPHMMTAVDEGTLRMRNCPMFDGSMDPYLETWDDTLINTMDFANAALGVPPTIDNGYASGYASGAADGGSSNPGIQQTGFHDLWATMTMGWGQEGNR